MKHIGVLALQGDFAEHKTALERSGAQAVEVRLPHHLIGLDGLIIPGGESTTLRKLMDMYGLMQPLRDFAQTTPTWGTCAGAIMLAREIIGQEAHLGVMDITVQRNAFGRQINSFVTTLDIDGERYEAVFIRAPLIVSVGNGVEVLSRLEDGRIVAAQQGHLLATSFHPELTPDLGFHRRFLNMIGS
ncbi:MAG: pyridoxal 5'-phosphate synthase glutaminase subunit PdxT [Anaerolineaceae bacterium]|nr:pyridoxal 5'-phosphate synthase glutaminase subunit PdxT [Anaerolineaceae bacterium]